MNKKLLVVLAFAFVTSTYGVSAQSWYSDELNYYSPNVAGAKSENARGGKPETLPSQAKKPEQANSNSNENQSTNSSSKNSENFLRKNDFNELKEFRNLNTEDRQLKIDELKAAQKAERCEIIKNNINRRVDYYQNSHSTVLNRYQGIAKGIQNAISRLQALGIDTSILDVSVTELTTMIAEMNALHNDLVFNLVSLNNPNCTDDENYRSDVNTARDSLKELRTKVLEIKDHIKIEIVTAFQQLKDQQSEDDESEPEDQTDSDTTTESEIDNTESN